MGGIGSKVTNMVTTINSICTSEVVKIIQSASQETEVLQTLDIDCRQALDDQCNINQECSSFQTQCFDALKDYSSDTINKVCGENGLITSCGAEDISMSGALNINLKTISEDDIKTNLQNSISNNIKSQATQELNLLSFGDKEENEITEVSNIVTKIAVNVVNNDLSKISSIQNINIKGYELQVASISSVQKIVSDTLSNNSIYISAVNNLANTLVATSTESSKLEGPLTILFYALGIILGGFIILGLILWIIKRKKST